MSGSEKTEVFNDIVVSIPEPQKFTATLEVGGMTCAACILSIKEGVQDLECLEEVSVSLLTNSAIVVFFGPESNVALIVERVEDRGFDCDVESIAELGGLRQEDEQKKRTVLLRVAGVDSDDCVKQILLAMESSMLRINLNLKKLLAPGEAILEVTYIPQPKILTIRDIISAIEGIDEKLEATIYHPPTIEERSRIIQLRERRRLLYRFLLSLIVAIPTFLIGVVWMSLVPSTNSLRRYFSEKMWAGSNTRAEWALFILATPVYFFAADVFHLRAIKEIRALWSSNSTVPIFRRFCRFGSMNLLMSLGTSIAYFPSIVVLGLDGRKSDHYNSKMSTTYFDAVVFLTMFILAGRYLEAYSKTKTGDAVALLGRLRPTEALLVKISEEKDLEEVVQTGASIKKINIDLLEVGDIVRIPHGASPPADGLMLSTGSVFDESPLTGESCSISKAIGDQVFTGTVNTGKPVDAQVTGIVGESMLDQIVRVVREGQTKRAPVERIADILTGYFVPVITLIAIMTFVVWLGLGLGGALPNSWRDTDTGGWAFWALQFAIAVFVGACPCGIALAAPTALFVGSGLAAKYGILVKGGGEAFQEASNLDIVVFDKTGTLTEGRKPVVTDHDIIAMDLEEEKIIWTLAQALEECSSHPIAKAITALCATQAIFISSGSSIEEFPGHGLKGTFMVQTTTGNTQYEVAIGNESFIRSLGAQISSQWSDKATSWKNAGKSLALLVLRPLTPSAEKQLGFKVAAQFAISDPIRPEAATVLSALRNEGLAVWMISGDNTATSISIGSQLGISPTQIIAGVLPTEKADKIRWLQNSRGKRNGRSGRAIVAMVGDGINDAPALVAADVGIAIGSGSDVAISSAKFVLLSSNLHCLLTLVTLSRMVFRRVKFNFAWALVYNLALLPIAAGAIYPAPGRPRLNPVWASLAMALSSLSVISSSLIMRTRLPLVGFNAAKKTVIKENSS